MYSVDAIFERNEVSEFCDLIFEGKQITVRGRTFGRVLTYPITYQQRDALARGEFVQLAEGTYVWPAIPARKQHVTV